MRRAWPPALADELLATALESEGDLAAAAATLLAAEGEGEEGARLEALAELLPQWSAHLRAASGGGGEGGAPPPLHASWLALLRRARCRSAGRRSC